MPAAHRNRNHGWGLRIAAGVEEIKTDLIALVIKPRGLMPRSTSETAVVVTVLIRMCRIRS